MRVTIDFGFLTSDWMRKWCANSFVQTLNVFIIQKNCSKMLTSYSKPLLTQNIQAMPRKLKDLQVCNIHAGFPSIK